MLQQYMNMSIVYNNSVPRHMRVACLRLPTPHRQTDRRQRCVTMGQPACACDTLKSSSCTGLWNGISSDREKNA